MFFIFLRILYERKKNHSAMFSLHPAQENIYFDQIRQPDEALYNIGAYQIVSFEIDVNLIRHCWTLLHQHLDAFRLMLGEQTDSAPKQYIRDQVEAILIERDFSNDLAPEKAAQCWMNTQLIEPMDFLSGQTVSAALLKVAKNKHYLFLCFHHIVIDGVGVTVMLDYLYKLYDDMIRQEDISWLSDIPQYRPHAEKAASYLDSHRYEKDRDYWRKKICYKHHTRLSPHHDGKGNRDVNFVLPEHVVILLANFCAVNKVSPLAVLTSAVHIYFSEEQRSTLQVVLHGRKGRAAMQVVGMFSDSMLVTCHHDPSWNFGQLAQQNSKEIASGLRHCQFPTSHLSRLLKSAGEALPDIIVNYEHFEHEVLEEDKKIPLIHLKGGWEQQPLQIRLIHYAFNEHMSLKVTCGRRYFSRQEGEFLARQLLNIIEYGLQETSWDIEKLALMSVPERPEPDYLHVYNDTAAELPVSLLHLPILEQAKRRPTATAIASDTRCLTYRQLVREATRVAYQLDAHGVQPNSLVAVVMKKGWEQVVAVLGILMVGAAYLPIDAKLPAARRAQLLASGKVRVAMTQPHLCAQDSGVEGIDWLSVVPLDEALLVETWPFAPRQSLTDLAYVIFTSGSTGTPKGVMMNHQAVSNTVLDINARYGVSSEDRVLALSALNFDLSVWDIFGVLAAGGQMILPAEESLRDPGDWGRLMRHYGVTMWNTVPALQQMWLDWAGEQPVSDIPLRLVILSGDWIPLGLPTQLRALHPGAALHSQGGATEAAIWSIGFPVGLLDPAWSSIPYGYPLANQRMYVLDRQLHPCLTGSYGEIYIGGVGLADGYWDDVERTAAQFIVHPKSGERLYRTGDLGWMHPDGYMVFVGRNDSQVKIHGYRIELGEVESALGKLPGVKQALVIARERDGDKYLAAYVVAEEAADVALLRQMLAERLPDYMLPATFTRITAIPLTANGKLDRCGLPEPVVEHQSSMVFAEPQGETERLIADIWSQLLGVKCVSRHDNFFELGGHSLLAVKLIVQLRRAHLIAGVQTLFSAPTLAALALALEVRHDVDLPENQICADTQHITPNMLPLVELEQDEIESLVARVQGGIKNIQDIYALSPLQEGIFFHHLLTLENDPYLLSALLRFDSRERLDSWFAAMQQVVDRHDILRTVFFNAGLSIPVQVVCRQAKLSLIEVFPDPAEGPIEQQLATQYAPSKARQDLSVAPLLYFVAARHPEGGWCVLQQWHHLIGDHSTLELINEEVCMIMDGNGHALPSAPLFREAIARALLEKRDEDHDQFFHNMLADVSEPVLPFNLKDIHGCGQQSVVAHRELPDELNLLARQQAKRLGISLASLCHLAWAQVVACSSGREAVVFGTVLLGRMAGGEESERAMGLFINTLPLRLDIDGRSVEDAARQAHLSLSNLLAHEHASLARAQRCSGVNAGSPLFSSLLNYRHHGKQGQTQLPEGIRLLSAEEQTNYPLVLSVEASTDSLGLTVQVVESLDANRICDYMQQALASLVEALACRPDTAISDLPVVPDDECSMLTKEWNNTARDYPQHQCVHTLFEVQAQRTPNAIAVVQEEDSLTYAQLNRRANQLANRLIKAGIEPGERVAIYLARSSALVIAQLAILKASALYVPIDPGLPVTRQQWIIEDSRAAWVIIGENDAAHICTEVGRLCVDSVAGEYDSNPLVTLSSTSAAYIMYTSGSTGKPKGVMVTHRGISRLVINNGFAELDHTDRVAFASNPAFDAATFEVWGALLNGGCLVVVEPTVVIDANQFAAVLEQQNITTLFLTTSLFNQYAHIIGTRLAQLKYLLSGGEVANPHAFAEVLNVGGPVRLIHAYGPTETTTFATTAHITAVEVAQSRLPIGRPIGNTCIYLLDIKGNPVPLGAVGEICIGGIGVALGYLNQPALTAERFLADPFTPGGYIYRTGDLARYLPDGNIDYIGRNDQQVKIRGFRIELEEIENVLIELPEIKQAVVIDLARDGNKYLAAYVVADNPVDFHGLYHALAARLPDYMVPAEAAFTQIDAVPLTCNGKLDRRLLPEPVWVKADNYTTPKNDLETQLCLIWQQVLKLDKIGTHDDFFSIGGDSILGLKLVSRINQRLHKGLSVADLFIHPTVAKQSHYLSLNTDGALLKKLSSGAASLPPLLMVHPAIAGCEVYHSLATRLSPYFNCYGLDNHNILSEYEKINCLSTLAELYLTEAENAGVLEGPVQILGWSLGGVIALEMAAILEKRGVKDIHVLLLDSFIYANSAVPDAVSVEGMVQLLPQLGYDELQIKRAMTNISCDASLASSCLSGVLERSQVTLLKAGRSSPFDSDSKAFSVKRLLNITDNYISDWVTQLEIKTLPHRHHHDIIEEEITIAEVVRNWL